MAGLKSAQALREQADRVSREVSDRPLARARFLNRERTRVARTLLPLSGAHAILLVGSLVLELVGSREVAVLLPLAAGAALAGLSLLLLPVLRREIRRLFGLAVVSPTAIALCLAAAARPGNMYFAFVLVVLVSSALALPLGPRLVLVIGGASVVATVAAGAGRLPHAWLAVSLVVGFTLAWARARRRRVLASFHRTEKLSLLVQRLRSTQEELVVAEKLEAMRVLVGGVAHELNNALAVAQVSVDAASGAEPARAKDLLGKAKGGLGRIKRTVDRLRRFAMGEGGELEPADVAAMLDFALESAIGRARSGVVIDRRYEVDVGTIRCHVSALAEALFQVAKNAVESMPKGGTITARVKQEGDSVVMSVEDEGHGISKEDLARVFDPYFTRERPQSVYTTIGGGKARGGAGMGLSVVYGLVTAVGGNVKIKSDAGKGTEVAIFLPRR